MVETLPVILPAAGVPEPPTGDDVVDAALRAIRQGAKRPGNRWSWISARLNVPQIRALRDYLEGLPRADTVGVRVAREDAISRLDVALAAVE